MKSLAIWVGVLLALCALPGCSQAESLGDEEPISFEIQGSPSWENGIGALVGAKCGYCHAQPKPAEAPNNIPADLDLTRYETYWGDDGIAIRGGDAIGRWIYEGILDHEVRIFANTSKPRKMPLDYGTPVTEREKGYLMVWSAAGSPRGAVTLEMEGNPAGGRSNYFIYCGSCHGSGKGAEDQGELLGPAFRRAAVTNQKVRSMWMTKAGVPLPGDQELADLRAYILSLNLEL